MLCCINSKYSIIYISDTYKTKIEKAYKYRHKGSVHQF